MENKVWVFVVLVVALVAVAAYVGVNAGIGEKQTISVSGESEVTTTPDFVSVYLTIETIDDSAQDSKDENAEITQKVIDALDDLGFADEEIETISWRIDEQYNWRSEDRDFEGYRTTHQIKVEVEEYDFVGTVIDDVVEAGALISYMNFEISEEHEAELKAQALEEATQDAKVKAEALARGADKKLGKLVNLNSGNYYSAPYRLYDAGAEYSVAEAKSAATQISPRELTVRANVQAVYSLK